MYIPSKVLAVVAVFATVVHCDPAPRLLDGQQVDHLRQFPHHVLIVPLGGVNRECGGNILHKNWILTSSECIRGSSRLELHFGMKDQNDDNDDYFTISVNKEHVYMYPTDYDDLALVKIPMDLVWTDTIAAVPISTKSIESLRGRFAVLPGFDEMGVSGGINPMPISPAVSSKESSNEPDLLKYGMFNVLDNSICSQNVEVNTFDEYTQICTEGWGKNQNTPCDSDFGSGLIVGWPAYSELIGLFSVYSPKCDHMKPAVYTYVPRYKSWIDSMISG